MGRPHDQRTAPGSELPAAQLTAQINPKLLGPVYTDLHHDLGKGCPGKCGVLTTSSSWSGTDLSPCQPARGLLTTPADCSTASPQVRSRSRATRRRNLGLTACAGGWPSRLIAYP